MLAGPSEDAIQRDGSIDGKTEVGMDMVGVRYILWL